MRSRWHETEDAGLQSYRSGRTRSDSGESTGPRLLDRGNRERKYRSARGPKRKRRRRAGRLLEYRKVLCFLLLIPISLLPPFRHALSQIHNNMNIAIPSPVHINMGPSAQLSNPKPSSSSPSIFRPRRSSDWQEYRPIIEGLYRNRRLKLKDVKEIMERDYNFFASEKQFKDRLAQWHVRKNIKANEADIMHRKQQKRAARGKQTAFRVGGQSVSFQRIARIRRRNGLTSDASESDANKPRNDRHALSPEPDTPSDMSCYTPEPEDRSSETLSPSADVQPDPKGKLDTSPDTGHENHSTPEFVDLTRDQHAFSGPVSLAEYEEHMNDSIMRLDRSLAAFEEEHKQPQKSSTPDYAFVWEGLMPSSSTRPMD